MVAIQYNEHVCNYNDFFKNIYDPEKYFEVANKRKEITVYNEITKQTTVENIYKTYHRYTLDTVEVYYLIGYKANIKAKAFKNRRILYNRSMPENFDRFMTYAACVTGLNSLRLFFIPEIQYCFTYIETETSLQYTPTIGTVIGLFLPVAILAIREIYRSED